VHGASSDACDHSMANTNKVGMVRKIIHFKVTVHIQLYVCIPNSFWPEISFLTQIKSPAASSRIETLTF